MAIAPTDLGHRNAHRERALDERANGFFEIPSTFGRFPAERMIAKGQSGEPTALVRVKTWLRDDDSSTSLTDIAQALRTPAPHGFRFGNVARLR